MNGTSGTYTLTFKYVSGSGSTVAFGTTDKGTKIVYATADDSTDPNMVDTGNPVNISGQLIHPGDLIFADKIGIITIPIDIIDELPAKIEELHTKEANLMAYLQSKEFSLEGLLKKSGLD